MAKSSFYPPPCLLWEQELSRTARTPKFLERPRWAKICSPYQSEANHLSRNPVYSKQHLPSTKLSPSSARGPRSLWTCSCSARVIRMLPVLVSVEDSLELELSLIDCSACLPHYTSGQTYYYPAFNAGRTEDAMKFAHEFGEVLAMPIMLEAVIRVRASRGAFSIICPSDLSGF